MKHIMHHNAIGISTSPTIDLFLGVGNTLVPSIGTQINIENLNIDMSSKSLLDHEDGGQCLVIDQREIKAEQGLVLGKVLYSKYCINFAQKMSLFSALDYFDSKKYTFKSKLTVFSLFCHLCGSYKNSNSVFILSMKI